MLRTHLGPLMILALALSLLACSDDSGSDKDAAPPDMALADQGVSDLTADADQADQQVGDAAPQPDTLQLNPSDWDLVKAAPTTLNEVWGVDTKQVYAVGEAGTIMTYDGTKWLSVNNPAKDAIHGIYNDGSRLFVIGEQVDLIYDGTDWVTAGSSTTKYDLVDLWGGSTHLMTVQKDSYYMRYRALTSTSSWSSKSLSTYTDGNLKGIWGADQDHVFVVGENATIARCTSSCASYSGTWSQMTAPSGVSATLTAVWGSSATDVFAVGYDGVILHFDGSAWTKMTTNTSSYFQDVWGSGPNDVYAVGHPIFKGDEAMFHYDGSSWTKVPLPTNSFLNSVWGSGANDVWAVGKSHILHYAGAKN